MTRILHISDTHGGLPTLRGEFDVVVHSGDFLPNRSFGHRVVEETFQCAWIENNAARLRAWLDDKPLLLTHGNHDFVDAAPILRSLGIDAHCLDNRKHTFNGISFYGFPYVPYFRGVWNFECTQHELEVRTETMDLEGVDVLVAHSPIYGLLDRNAEGTRCGSKPMRRFLESSAHVPSWYLCGHIHEAAGYKRWKRDIDVSNAACDQRVIDT